MVNGNRVRRSEQFSFCTSNPDAVQKLIDTVKAYLRSHPEVTIVGLIPEDGYGQPESLCHCPGCTAMDVANGFNPDEQYRPWTRFRAQPGTDPL